MARLALTDRFITSPKRVPESGRADYFDAVVPGLALRVTSNGHRSFVLVARYPANPKNPTRRAIGTYGAVSLDRARQTARSWLEMIGKGVDPKIEEEAQKAKIARANASLFSHVADEFLSRYVKGASYCELERRAAVLQQTDPKLTPSAALRSVMADPANAALVQRSKREGLAHKQVADAIIQREFITKWGRRPITDIRPEECAAAIREIVGRGTPSQAHSSFEWLRRLFNWTVGTNEFGMTASPVASLRPTDLIGKKEARDRVLTDDEIRAVWGACDGMQYPYGPLIRLLILTAQREREVADMRWSEIDFDAAVWTVPPDRAKSGRAHAVPLPPDSMAILRGLPRFTVGDFVFTTTDGATPVNGFSRAKVRIDKLSGVTGWRFHDLRRTARTHFSALPVQDLVRELVIAHARPGLHKVYDQHSYLDEKRECLTLWEQRLRGILAPKPPADVADIEAARARRGGA